MTTIDLSTAETFAVTGQTVWADYGSHEVAMRLPRSAKVTLYKRTDSATLHVGSVGRISVTIIGPLADITGLFKTLSDTPAKK